MGENSSRLSINKRKLLIYLADPVHNYILSRDIWTIPLNVLTIASYTMAKFKNNVEIKIFKFPDEFFNAMKKELPDIVGVSNYIWNYELSKTLLLFSKKQNRKIVTVMGGPNITQSKDRMTVFLKNSYCDYYISGSGEYPFRCLVESIIYNKISLINSLEIQGCWQLDLQKKIAFYTPPEYTIQNLDEIPSPFTNDMANDFFQKGLMPMIETVRGCPFHCTYCDWGNATFGQIFKYSINRVKKDIDYCRNFSKDERLMIDDANFGLFVERDLEIAIYIKYLRDKYNWPGKLILTWGQVKSDQSFRIADSLRDLCMITQSSQSMDIGVLKNIKRYNISKQDWIKSVGFCKKHNIETYAELMIPLPGETLSSYLDAIKFFFHIEVDFINTNPLMLLEGAEMNSKSERIKYNMKTKWRLLENCYGIYEGLNVIEYQEMVIETNTFSIDDYFYCRMLSWLIQMSWNLKRHDLLFRLMNSFGINPIDFFIKIIQKPTDIVKNVFDNFLHDAKEELFETKEELIANYSIPSQMKLLKQGGFRKLNTYYSSLVALKYHKEFINHYELIANILIDENKIEFHNKDIIHDCSKFLTERFLTNEDIANLESGFNIDKQLAFKYDFPSWINNSRNKIFEFKHPDKILYNFYISEEQKNALLSHLKNFSGLSREYQLRKLQEPYHGIHKKHLLFNINKV